MFTDSFEFEAIKLKLKIKMGGVKMFTLKMPPIQNLTKHWNQIKLKMRP